MRTCKSEQDSLLINSFIKLFLMACCLQFTSCVTRIEMADIGKDWYSFIDSGESAQKRWNQISATDGINVHEACFLSTVYFERYNGICGWSFISGHTKDEWIFEAFVGRNAVSVPPIKVDKRTGRIRQRESPTSTPPWADLMERLKIGYGIPGKGD